LLALLLFMVMAADHPALGLPLAAFTEVMVAVTEVMAVVALTQASALGVVVLAAILAKAALAEIETRIIMDFRVTVTAVQAAAAALGTLAVAVAALVFLGKGAMARAVRLVRLVSPAEAAAVALAVVREAIYTVGPMGVGAQVRALALPVTAQFVSSGQVHHACSHRLGQGTYKVYEG
jgi:hypothetical protein